MPAPVVHFELGFKNSQKAATFYGPLFGWEFHAAGPAMMLGNIGPMAPKPTPGIGGHFNALGHEPHNYCVVYVQVDDLAATLKHAGTFGGATVVPPTEVPGMGTFAWLKDPEGNLVGLWKPVAR